MNKRLLKEVRHLILQQQSKPLLENDYIVNWDPDDITVVNAFIKPPNDSVYRHKFIRLDFKIGDSYPYSPPEVTFVNYDGVRIHPNMYENGKCCATILNTWGDNELEKWTSSMGIETILVMFHSFLDNNPYTYEPGGKDDPSYSVYVEFQSWHTCLIRYLQYESIPSFVQYMHEYLLANVDGIFTDLYSSVERYPNNAYYCGCFEIDHYFINYSNILLTMQNIYGFLETPEDSGTFPITESLDNNNNNNNNHQTTDYACSVCFDTKELTETVLSPCGHRFHKVCLDEHVAANAALCPMCRGQLVQTDSRDSADSVDSTAWVINPLTKRKVKVGGKTWKYLKDNDFLPY
jgi:ubiquitin-protein ligase